MQFYCKILQHSITSCYRKFQEFTFVTLHDVTCYVMHNETIKVKFSSIRESAFLSCKDHLLVFIISTNEIFCFDQCFSSQLLHQSFEITQKHEL